MMTVVHQIKDRDFAGRVEAMADAARKLHYEEVAACRRIGQLSLDLVPNGATILTHCNAGALATGGYGTALGVVRAAQEAGKNVRVLACETRPYLQGARLTAWELAKDLIPVEVITDSMAAHFMAKGLIQLCVVGEYPQENRLPHVPHREKAHLLNCWIGCIWIRQCHTCQRG